MRDTHLDLRSHFMTHRRYIFSDPAFWLIGYIMIYHKITGSKFLYVPIKLHHLSPFGWTHPVATPLRSAPIRAPHGALALAAEVVDGILGPAGTKCRFFLFFFFFLGLKKNLLKNVTLMSRLRMCPHISQIPKWFMEYCRATEPGRIRKTVCPWVERKLRPTSKWFIARVACWLLGSCSYWNTRKKTRVEVWLYPMTLANILDKKRLV
jgi:hypothetical protein